MFCRLVHRTPSQSHVSFRNSGFGVPTSDIPPNKLETPPPNVNVAATAVSGPEFASCVHADPFHSQVSARAFLPDPPRRCRARRPARRVGHRSALLLRVLDDQDLHRSAATRPILALRTLESLREPGRRAPFESRTVDVEFGGDSRVAGPEVHATTVRPPPWRRLSAWRRRGGPAFAEATAGEPWGVA